MCFIAITVSVCGILYTADTHESTAFEIKHGKYLRVSDTTYDFAENTSQAQAQNAKIKMNSLDVENAENVETVVNTANFVKTDTLTLENRYSETINVYFHQTGKTEQMSLEEYIVGVVLSEMPSSFSSQALMAQAVAVRSFTCYKAKNGGLSSHRDAAVCTDYRHCQSYISPEEYVKKGDYARQAVEKIREAVEATRGICAVYEGEPIMAVYHASSGSGTKNSSDVWGGEIEYLSAVPAAEKLDVCCEEYEFGYDELEKKLSDEKGSVSCFSVLGRQVSCQTGDSGLVTSMDFSGRIFDSGELKRKLGLRSEEFSAVLSDDGITFIAYGYGHRVGMSQYGADALANKGYGFMDILKYYYKGISFAYAY